MRLRSPTSTPSTGTQIQLKSDWSITGVPGNWDPFGNRRQRVIDLSFEHRAWRISDAHRGSDDFDRNGKYSRAYRPGLQRSWFNFAQFHRRQCAEPGAGTDPHVMVVPLVDFTAAGKN